MRKIKFDAVTHNFRNRWLITWKRKENGELMTYLLSRFDHGKSSPTRGEKKR